MKDVLIALAVALGAISFAVRSVWAARWFQDKLRMEKVKTEERRIRRKEISRNE